jgi:DNA-binding response OmpR family regulator
MRILIIEDETLWAREINRFLQKEGFKCKEAHNGRIALELIHAQKFDMILLDLKLPDYDGLELMKKILSLRSGHAVIILSAKSSTEDRIEGLNMGADDFLTKPIPLEELKSRILAVMRRKSNITGNILRIVNIEIDFNSRNVTCQGTLIRLTRKEYDLLIYLVINRNRVVSRLQLSENIWGDVLEQDYNSNFIDAHIKNLRKKLAKHLPVDFLETIRGVGFRLNELSEPANLSQ